MKAVLLSLALLMSTIANAQFLTADVGINGLTCSQCCNSVAVQLQKLPFVASVTMDLEETTAHISFKRKGKIDWLAIPKAIRNAGFSIRDVSATFNADGAESWEERHFMYKGMCYSSANPLEKGLMELRFIGKGLNAKGSELAKEADFATDCRSKNGFAIIQTNAKRHD